MKRVLREFAKSLGQYLLFVVGGTLGFMCLAPVFGYLGRSVPWSEWGRGVSLILGWGVLLLPYAAIVGVILLGAVRGLEWIRTPRILVQLASGVFAGLLSAYVVAAIGWYINLDERPVYVALLLGIICGVCILPKKHPVGERGV